MSKSPPAEWMSGELSTFCDVVGGGTPDRSVANYWGGDIPWAAPTEITSRTSKFISDTKERITQYGLEKSSARLLPVGTVLMTSRASIGHVAINTVPMATNQGFQSLLPKRDVLAEYLYHYITWFRPMLEMMSAGSTFSEISSSNVRKLNVTFPRLPEQQKIATILSSVDDVIEKTRAQIDKLKDLKTGMMQELLTKGIGHTEFKDSPVGRVPAEWGIRSVGQLFHVQLGKMLSKAAKVGDTPFPYLGNKNVQWGKVDLSDLEEMDFSDKERAKFLLKFGDLLMCEGGDVGRTAIWRDELANCYFQKAIHRLRPINNSYNPALLMEYFRFAKATGLLTSFISQTSIAHLTKEKLESVQIPVPSLEEQSRLVAQFEAINDHIDKYKAKNHNLQSLKKALMQDLLTGKVRVNVNNNQEVAVA